ncbi:hypothetical protein ACFSX9_15600 [Flavobacterium ardleyense]|uniref:Uncharacterized protein n=1 Tax=Flavobacterium ardleyense TaxID=2038737 RepID=A0ABW5ZB75_9FLAO
MNNTKFIILGFTLLAVGLLLHVYLKNEIIDLIFAAFIGGIVALLISGKIRAQK